MIARLAICIYVQYIQYPKYMLYIGHITMNLPYLIQVYAYIYKFNDILLLLLILLNYMRLICKL